MALLYYNNITMGQNTNNKALQGICGAKEAPMGPHFRAITQK